MTYAIIRIRDGCVMQWHTTKKQAEKSLLAFGDGFTVEPAEAPTAVKIVMERLARL